MERRERQGRRPVLRVREVTPRMILWDALKTKKQDVFDMVAKTQGELGED
jgi:hypothetical protein